MKHVTTLKASMSERMVAGTFVWTLFDYYGESSKGGFPELSSSFGVFDLAGFVRCAFFDRDLQ
jgi:hypothetical protein